ncbi:MAG: hypothetical protein MUO26_06935 [Methanotrichaceae archaeon]|nr:hypothetical protein [Methanotrichaceae archaeon]
MFLALSLTDLTSDPSLYDEKRFMHIELSNLTRELIGQNPQGDKLRILNRLLLEEAYPNEIAKIRKPIVYDKVRRTTNPESTQPNKREIPFYINNDFRVFELIVNSLLLGRRKHSRLDDRSSGLLSGQISDQLRNFIRSEYAGHFIKKFGISFVLHFVEGLTEFEYLHLAECAQVQGFITFEEFIEFAEYDDHFLTPGEKMKKAWEIKHGGLPDYIMKIEEKKKKKAKGDSK